MRAIMLVGLALLRVCVVLLSVEVSGLAHTCLDLCDAFSGVASAEAESCDDDCGDECPPGCPNCHCWRGAPAPDEALSLVSADAASVSSFTRADVSVVPPAAKAPAGADPASIYRPPRSRAHS
jgi:hypothetical protein